MRFWVVVVLVGMLAGLATCGPTSHRGGDEWGEGPTKEPMISGDNDRDEARWRRELGRLDARTALPMPSLANYDESFRPLG